MNAIEKAEKKAASVLDAARSQYSGIQSELEAFKTKRDAAAEEMETAQKNCDLTAYNRAKTAFDDAQTAITMYEGQAERLEGKALLDEKEYKALAAGVLDEVDKYINDLREEMYEITKNLEAKRHAAADTIHRAERVLHCLQYDCYRGRDLVYRGTMKTPDPSSVLKAGTRKQWDIVAWAGKLPGSSGIYAEMKKERGE